MQTYDEISISEEYKSNMPLAFSFAPQANELQNISANLL